MRCRYLHPRKAAAAPHNAKTTHQFPEATPALVLGSRENQFGFDLYLVRLAHINTTCQTEDVHIHPSSSAVGSLHDFHRILHVDAIARLALFPVRAIHRRTANKGRSRTGDLDLVVGARPIVTL